MSAVPTKAPRNPYRISSPIESFAATRAPSVLPVKSIPNASERRFAGKAWRTACAAAGKEGASAAPRSTRRRKRAPNEKANACALATTDQTSTAAAKPRRAPRRSTSTPASGAPMRYAIENALSRKPYRVLSIPSDFVTEGAIAASV